MTETGRVPLRVVVLYNDDGALASGEGRDVLAVSAVVEMARAVAASAGRLGHVTELVPAPGEARALLEALDRSRPDVVFNLVESLNGDARLESAVALLMELEGIAFTGSPPLALSMALDKPTARAMLISYGVPVPAGTVMRTGREPIAGSAPWIVKPSREDASHGISLQSVVASESAVRERAAWIERTYGQPALVEEFIAGREFNVSLLGQGDQAEVLSLAEIDFSRFPSGRPHVVTYEAKWVETSDEYKGSPSVAAEALGDDVRRRVAFTARQAYAALGLRDYGRVDMRLRDGTEPLVIDINPNPDITPGAGLAKAAERSGKSYDDLIGFIIDQAAGRRHHPPRTPRG